MPFKSEAQRRFMYAKHPQIAKRWQKHTPKGVDLPEKKNPEETVKKSCIAGIKIASAAGPVWQGGPLMLHEPRTLAALLGTGLLSTALGTGLGYGAAKLTEPSLGSVENLQREELAEQYGQAIDTLKQRLAQRSLQR